MTLHGVGFGNSFRHSMVNQVDTPIVMVMARRRRRIQGMGSLRAHRASDTRLKQRGMWKSVVAVRITTGSMVLRRTHRPSAHAGVVGAVGVATVALGLGEAARAHAPPAAKGVKAKVGYAAPRHVVVEIGVEHAATHHVVHGCVVPIVTVSVPAAVTTSVLCELRYPALSRAPTEGLLVQAVQVDADACVHVIPDCVANPCGNVAST